MIKLLFSFLLFLLITSNFYGQKLDKQTRIKLKYTLDSIGKYDQMYRWELTFGELDKKKIDSLSKLSNEQIGERIKKTHQGLVGFNQAIRDSLNKLQNRLDSLNILAFEQIIYKYGYPSYKRVKSYTTKTLTLHLMGKKNFEKYLPILKNELEKGNMDPNDFAAWYDRNQIIMKKKQLYGEYIKDFPCVENLENSNSERQKIGLRPLKKNECRNE